MSIPGSAAPFLLAQQPEQYRIQRSLRFNSSDSAYLSRTPSTAGNRKTWTWAGWVKRTTVLNQTLFSVYVVGGNYTIFGFDADVLRLEGDVPAVNVYTAALLRDPSAWYHVVLAVDTAQATAANRVKMYVNGVEQPYGGTSYPAQNVDLNINTTSSHRIGSYNNARYLDGYLADIHFIDGQALDPTSFGEFDTNGVWQPKAYTGTYGTNGFHLPFSDNSTDAALGTDTSGAGNNWTVNNISVAAGAGNDSLVDTPTNYGTDTGAGGEVKGNYATLNPLAKATTLSLSNGNLDVVGTTAGAYASCLGTFGMSSGKWYWEQTLTSFTSSDIQLGMGNKDTVLSAYPGATFRGYGFSSNNSKWNSGVSAAYTTGWVNGDIIGLAFDADAGTLTLYKNGASLGVAFSSIPADTYFPVAGGYTTASVSSLNFGQRPFAFSAPLGFKALCTANLP